MSLALKENSGKHPVKTPTDCEFKLDIFYKIIEI